MTILSCAQEAMDAGHRIAELEAQVNSLKTELRLYKRFYELSREAHGYLASERARIGLTHSAEVK